jgi:hypothetical protein
LRETFCLFLSLTPVTAWHTRRLNRLAYKIPQAEAIRFNCS